jgi:hypothetical protein
MTLAFLTGAVAAGVAAAGLAALGTWVVTVLAGSSGPWAVAPWLLPGVAAVVGLATYVGERVAHRRTLARMASHGEPWAYRHD